MNKLCRGVASTKGERSCPMHLTFRISTRLRQARTNRNPRADCHHWSPHRGCRKRFRLLHCGECQGGSWRVIAKSRELGYTGVGLDACVALAEIEMRTGQSTAGRAHLTAIAIEAIGYDLLATEIAIALAW